MIEETNHERRKLERERRQLERPQPSVSYFIFIVFSNFIAVRRIPYLCSLDPLSPKAYPFGVHKHMKRHRHCHSRSHPEIPTLSVLASRPESAIREEIWVGVKFLLVRSHRADFCYDNHSSCPLLLWTIVIRWSARPVRLSESTAVAFTLRTSDLTDPSGLRWRLSISLTMSWQRTGTRKVSTWLPYCSASDSEGHRRTLNRQHLIFAAIRWLQRNIFQFAVSVTAYRFHQIIDKQDWSSDILNNVKAKMRFRRCVVWISCIILITDQRRLIFVGKQLEDGPNSFWAKDPSRLPSSQWYANIRSYWSKDDHRQSKVLHFASSKFSILDLRWRVTALNSKSS